MTPSIQLRDLLIQWVFCWHGIVGSDTHTWISSVSLKYLSLWAALWDCVTPWVTSGEENTSQETLLVLVDTDSVGIRVLQSVSTADSLAAVMSSLSVRRGWRSLGFGLQRAYKHCSLISTLVWGESCWGRTFDFSILKENMHVSVPRTERKQGSRGLLGTRHKKK